jgi:demethylmenaquinone methyltransferase / 2-methoxy-6-polyprenyl-1,4-benzoquinol methylase
MKSISTGSEKALYVKDVFRRIANRYDLMNHLMTAGQDRHWKRTVIRLAEIKESQRILDLGAGTGDLAREALRQQPSAHMIAADFTFEMLVTGQKKEHLPNVVADALVLPFPDASFDGVVSGYLLRNVGNLDRALGEEFRVMKNNGRLVILDTTRPRHNVLTPFIWLYMHGVIPLIGGIISGFQDAYKYLPESSEKFLNAEELAEKMSLAGFSEVGFQRFMFGTIAIHWGRK